MRNPIVLCSFISMVPLLYTILVTVEIYVVSSQCLSDQQSLLLQLKNNLKFDPTTSKKLVQWNQSSDCCSWGGVRCEEGRVAGLNLTNESISGGIFENSSLFNLQHLKSLDLSYNDFKSKIPPRIGNLTNLSVVNFSNAGFEGQIPKEISGMTRLVTLDFSIPFYLLGSSSLKLENPNLRMLVQNLTQLEELYLDGLNISASRKDWCQALSSSLPNLRVLSLSNCHVSGPIHHSLGKLHSLSVIRLDYNDLSAPVPGYFANFSNLTSLRLSGCGLNGTFPKQIFQVPTLRTLDISFNKLLEGSFPEFHPQSALQSLLVGSTNFSGKLPASFGNLKQLSRLDLSDCRFNGALPNSMTMRTQLVYLDLSLNNFSGPIPSFNMSRNFTRILLSHNGFNGAIPSSHWEGLLNLVDIDLRNNFLNGSIPPSLFSLPSLQKIHLSYNSLSGQVHEFQNAHSSLLDTLDLSSNNLQDPIPMSIFQLRKLQILSLSSNNFSGPVQLDMIQSLVNLTTLDLSYNSLSIITSVNNPTLSLPNFRTLKLASCKLKIFPYLKNQSKLVRLDLSDNQIRGVIPNWIWEVGDGSLVYLNLSHNDLVRMQEPYTLPNYLGVLDLHVNKLRGKIPTLPSFASHIDFSSNNFTSSIPVDIIGSSISSTIFFSLSNNGLTGVIPESICNASYLKVLDLSKNKLSGRIPACLSAMTLGVLNLQRNNFSGSIADAFQENCALHTLAANGNSIQGKIPKSLANCTSLEVLDLGNNEMMDHFPCFLKNISTLRVLVLRSNNFKGNIGCPNTSGTWKMLQIVDLASNNFSGKLSGQWFTTWEAMVADEDELDHLVFEFLNLDPSSYYQDAVTVTSKGQQIEMVKILTAFTSIDLSCNNFQGPIPREFGQLRLLFLLNLSHNTFTGQIPSSLGNLRQLESLDLSCNKLTGKIPTSLEDLTFLSFLNLSFNQLVGIIPSRNQFSTFSVDSFAGNKGLSGPPLTQKCSNYSKLADAEKNVASEEDEFDWLPIYTGFGFIVGAGDIIALLLFWEKGSIWLDNMTDKILLVLLPMLGFV